MNKFNVELLDSIEYVGEIVSSSKESYQMVLKKNQTIDPLDICFITDGIMNVRRKEDNLVILEAKAPFILGLTNLFNFEFNDVYIESVDECHIHVLKTNIFKELLASDHSRTWFHISNILGWRLHVYASRDKILSQKTVYDSIRIHLLDIWALPEESRLRTSIYMYILERIKISRSALHKVIYQLNFGEYITTKRGKLISVNNLPDTY